MLLDGEVVHKDDSLFSVVLGFGRVQSVGYNTVNVKFANGDQFLYDEGGVKSGEGRRTLFYHDPFAIIPPKDEAVWRKTKTAISAISEIIKGAK